MIKYTCPHCESLLSIDEQHAGLSGNCNRCGNGIVVPVIKGEYSRAIDLKIDTQSDHLITGRVAHFDKSKGRGVIIPDDGSEHVIVEAHAIEIEGRRSLKKNERVIYRPVPGSDLYEKTPMTEARNVILFSNELRSIALGKFAHAEDMYRNTLEATRIRLTGRPSDGSKGISAEEFLPLTLIDLPEFIYVPIRSPESTGPDDMVLFTTDENETAFDVYATNDETDSYELCGKIGSMPLVLYLFATPTIDTLFYHQRQGGGENESPSIHRIPLGNYEPFFWPAFAYMLTLNGEDEDTLELVRYYCETQENVFFTPMQLYAEATAALSEGRLCEDDEGNYSYTQSETEHFLEKAKFAIERLPPPAFCGKCNETEWNFVSLSPNRKSANWQCSYCNKSIISKGTTVDDTRSSRPAISKEVQHEVWRRDEGHCTDCGSKENLEFDHIIPLSLGGANTARNIQLLCMSCNRTKGASEPGDY